MLVSNNAPVRKELHQKIVKMKMFFPKNGFGSPREDREKLSTENLAITILLNCFDCLTLIASRTSVDPSSSPVDVITGTNPF